MSRFGSICQRLTSEVDKAILFFPDFVRGRKTWNIECHCGDDSRPIIKVQGMNNRKEKGQRLGQI